MEKFACSLCPKTFAAKFTLNRHMLSHEERKYTCDVCSKSYHRPDLLTKHRVKCVNEKNETNTCDKCHKNFKQKCHLSRHKKSCDVKHKESRMKEASCKYKQKLERGQLIESILKKCPDTIEQALDEADRECLRLYQQSGSESFQMGEVTLKPWQKEVIKFIDEPSERYIYWIVGKKGSEGKTFIQKYIRNLFGSRRVIHSEVNTKKADIAYLLSNETLTCKDIFLFNLLRSDNSVAYGILENVKDGDLISSKYKSKFVKVQTPNTIIVFSNSWPDCDQLSNDRWKVYEIVKDELKRRNDISIIKQLFNKVNYPLYLGEDW